MITFLIYYLIHFEIFYIFLADFHYVFNTKNKILSELVSNSTKGFEVSGSTIKNVDNSESREITLRNPDQTLPEILKNNKRNIDKVWSELTTKTRTTNSRINSNTILLRILDK